MSFVEKTLASLSGRSFASKGAAGGRGHDASFKRLEGEEHALEPLSKEASEFAKTHGLRGGKVMHALQELIADATAHDIHGDHGHGHGHGHDGAMPLLSMPEVIQRYGEPQAEVHIGWADIYLDLILVGVAFNGGLLLKHSFYLCEPPGGEHGGEHGGGEHGGGEHGGGDEHGAILDEHGAHRLLSGHGHAHPPCQGLYPGMLHVLAFGIPILGAWLKETNFRGRFEQRSLISRALECSCYLLMMIGASQEEDVVVLDTDVSFWQTFSLCMLLIDATWVIRYVYILWHEEKCARDTAVQRIWLLLPGTLCYGAAYWMSVFPNVADVDIEILEENVVEILEENVGAHAELTRGEIAEPMHIWYIPALLLVGANTPIMIELIAFLVTKYKPALPMNVNFLLHRSTEVFMVLLGEAVLQLVTSQKTEPPPGSTHEEALLIASRFSLTQWLGFIITLTIMHSFIINEPIPEHHVLVRGGAKSSLWVILFLIKAANVWMVGIAIKIALYDPEAPADAFFAQDQRTQFGSNVMIGYLMSGLMFFMHSSSVYDHWTKYVLQGPWNIASFVLWILNLYAMYTIQSWDLAIFEYMTYQAALGVLHMFILQLESVWLPAMGLIKRPAEVCPPHVPHVPKALAPVKTEKLDVFAKVHGLKDKAIVDLEQLLNDEKVRHDHPKGVTGFHEVEGADAHGDHGHGHGHGHAGAMPLLSMPEVVQRYGEPQGEVHIGWADIYLDLILVGVAFNGGLLLKHSFYLCEPLGGEHGGGEHGGGEHGGDDALGDEHGSSEHGGIVLVEHAHRMLSGDEHGHEHAPCVGLATGLLHVLAFGAPILGAWLKETNFRGRFLQHSLISRALECSNYVMMIIGASCEQDVQVMQADVTFWQVFSLSMLLIDLTWMIRYVYILFHEEACARKTAQQRLWLLLPGMLCYYLAYYMSAYSEAADKILFQLTPYLGFAHEVHHKHNFYIPVLLVFGANSPIMIELLAYPLIKYKPALPMNVNFLLHRSTEIFMVLLGEGVLQLVTSQVPEPAEHASDEDHVLANERFAETQVYGFIITLTIMHSFIINEPEPTHHVLNRGGAKGTLWVILFLVKALNVWLVGIGIKLALYDPGAPGDAFFSKDQRSQFGLQVMTGYLMSGLMFFMHSSSIYDHFSKYILQGPWNIASFVLWIINLNVMYTLTDQVLPIFDYIRYQAALGVLHMFILQMESVWLPAMGLTKKPRDVCAHPDAGHELHTIYKRWVLAQFRNKDSSDPTKRIASKFAAKLQIMVLRSQKKKMGRKTLH